jgi:hypothetical protein
VRAVFLTSSVVGCIGYVGCATVSGLDQIRESPCAPDCGASVSDDSSIGPEGSADTSLTVDSWQAGDSTGDDGAEDAGGPDATFDTTSPADAPADETSAADASDAPSDGGDAASDSADGSPDATNDGGCGPTNTTSNCGACGTSCAAAPSSAVATATCTGNSCTYTCQGGHLDCNASVAPNADGCECATPGTISATCCPSNACPTQHVTGFPTGQTGLDQTFYDCSTTVAEQVAMDACNQYSGPNPVTNKSNCQTNTQFGVTCTNGDMVVCNFLSGTQDCVCWAYQGPATGWAVSSGSTSMCLCPGGSTAAGDMQYH